ncbi:VWA domain-containing protein [Nonomuraea sp. SYSU D8015]|uniref:VWA domain-containing protein n=1 Tax=Nonomuraea sp. SYSU D8015 TaxID=2593644 RepID=UPI00166090F8|nr:VWA domain-containing protein [Nonomuraea sp. SYSU D8015]
MSVILLVLSPFVVPSAAEPAGELVVLLDVSGSMEESDGSGSTRIAAARKAIGGIVDAAPDGALLGLRSYGGGCTETDLHLRPSPLDRDAFKRKVAALRPRGDTPIAYALKQAAEDFTGDGPKTILLVSDGEETCGGDPVATAAELVKKGVDVQIDVVGFRVRDAARSQLVRIAKEGGGRYADAQNGDQLAGRLRRLAQRALRGQSPVGTPVTGTPDRQSAPLLKPGAYLDEMPPGGDVKRHYAFDLPAGATAYVGLRIGVTTPLGARAVIGSGLSIWPSDGAAACVTRDLMTDLPSGGSAFVVGNAQITEGGGPCEKAGRFTIEVDNRGDQVRDSTAPLELTLIVEPPAVDAGSLPPPATAAETVEPQVQASGAAHIAGSGSYGDGPVLADGRYTDTMIPGEEAYFRVPLAYGQRLTYRIEVPGLSEGDRRALGGARLRLSSSILSPENPRVLGGRENYAWQPTLGDQPQSFTGSSVPVAYRNRESDQDFIKDTTLPGYYNLWVRLFTDRGDPYVEVPVTLTVDVQGEPAGVPTLADPTGLGPPDRQQGLSLVPEPRVVTPRPAASTAAAPPATQAGASSVLPLLLVLSTTALAVVTAGAIWIVRRTRRRPLR